MVARRPRHWREERNDKPKKARGKMSTTKQASLNENIITGLKLSDAIKLLEENQDSQIRPHQDPCNCNFENYANVNLNVNWKYDVKLPPPKSVTVTKEQVMKSFLRVTKEWGSYSSAGEALCKELGL